MFQPRIVPPPRAVAGRFDHDGGGILRRVAEDALTHHGKPDICNTDQGSQLTGAAFTGKLIQDGIANSMDGEGTWRDTVFVERLRRSVSTRRYISEPKTPCPRRASIGRSTIAAGRIRALTVGHRSRPLHPAAT